MRTVVVHTFLFAGLALATAASAAAQATPQGAAQPHHVALEVGELTWVAGPPSLPAGAQMAVLEGTPSQPGPFTIRLRFPDGFRIAPHVHPGVERITVISGTFILNMGQQAQPGGGKALSAGGFAMMPPGTVHHVHVRGQTEVQLNGVGPWNIQYVDPADDPRRTSP